MKAPRRKLKIKRLGNIFNDIASLDNLLEAYFNAIKGKRIRGMIKKMESDNNFLFTKLQEIRDMLLSHTFKSSSYNKFYVNERGKLREINSLPFFPDRIVHWALMQKISDRMISNFTKDTYSTIPGRGVQLAVKNIQNAIYKMNKAYPNGEIYALQIDIKSYYATINKKRLKKDYRRLIKDKDALWLIDEIIDGFSPESPIGIPIGNYTSQFSANLYLSYLDHKIKEKWKVKHYFRYMDDILILSHSKKWLWKIYDKIVKVLTRKKLSIKKKSPKVVKLSSGLSFIGYVIYNGYVLLRNNIKKQLIKACEKVRKSGTLTELDFARINSYLGWASHANTYKLLEKYYDPIKSTIERRREEPKRKKLVAKLLSLLPRIAPVQQTAASAISASQQQNAH